MLLSKTDRETDISKAAGFCQTATVSAYLITINHKLVRSQVVKIIFQGGFQHPLR